MNSPYIVDVTSATFEDDVVKRSVDVPVVVDFWAEWCGPCKQLGPLLEALAEEYAGKFLLAKVNTEQSPDIAEGFGIRSIPAVFAIKEGRIVDSFVGGMPETAIRTWLDSLLPSEAELAVSQALDLEKTDPAAAEERYRHALRVAPEFAAAEIGLARVLLARGEVQEVHAWIKRLEARGFLEPEAEKIKAELTLREQAESVGDLGELRARMAANPDDLLIRYQLAEALASTGKYEESLGMALDLVERDPQGLREPARKLMINIFQLLPDDSELVADYRRQLFSAIY